MFGNGDPQSSSPMVTPYSSPVRSSAPGSGRLLKELAEVERLYPAKRYVMIDDKLRILNAMKQVWGERVTSVFPRQGHYAHDPQILADYPPADIQLDHLRDLTNYALTAFVTPVSETKR